MPMALGKYNVRSIGQTRTFEVGVTFDHSSRLCNIIRRERFEAVRSAPDFADQGELLG